MAKINHNNYHDTINELSINARNKGALYLEAENACKFPDIIELEGRELIPFNSCGYLGLEHHPKLKEGAIKTIEKYGVQFAISRIFVSTNIISELESALSKMFDNRPVITYTSTSLAHISFFPSILRRTDLIILDQQVHFSIQTAAHLLSHSGVNSTMIRHNNMEMLERFIKSNYNKYDRIWYTIDGVYSMFGDKSPIEEIDKLMTKYSKLYVYADDAHGMGWAGTNGTGVIFDRLKHQPNFVLSTTLGKAFGARGGLLVFPNEGMKLSVRNFGGPLSYSHPLQPPTVGVALASTEFFLSDELESAQNSLAEKMDYLHSELKKIDLPIVSHPETPIFYVGLGRPRTTFNMIQKLINDGFLLSAGIFPAVPMKCCGLRISLSNARTREEIRNVVAAIKQNLPKVLEEENVQVNNIYKAFNLENKTPSEALIDDDSLLQFDVEIHDDIVRIPKVTWDLMMDGKGVFDYDGLIDQQQLFSGNSEDCENFEFFYLIISDRKTMKPIVGTFFTSGIFKDDMLDAPEISKAIEKKREQDKYYLSSNQLIMGSPLSEGEHLYINREHPEWKNALLIGIDQMQKLGMRLKANSILIRDIDASDENLKNIFINEGLIPTSMPNANTTYIEWPDFESYRKTVSKNRRFKLRQEVLDYMDFYKCEIVTKPTKSRSERYYQLYKNIVNKNLNINMFPYPKEIFYELTGDNWEYLEIYLKTDLESEFISEPVGFVCAYVKGDSYTSLLAGMEYEYVKSHVLYKQILFRIMERAMNLGVSKINYGLSADKAKSKFGTIAEPKVAYAQITDMFNKELIASMSAATSV